MINLPHSASEACIKVGNKFYLIFFFFYAKEGRQEKEMETHSNILAWRIPWAEEPGRLQSMELQGLDMA